jgi:hypothetical protein
VTEPVAVVGDVGGGGVVVVPPAVAVVNSSATGNVTPVVVVAASINGRQRSPHITGTAGEQQRRQTPLLTVG